MNSKTSSPIFSYILLQICNRSSHWFAIRKINGRYYNLNSTLDRPLIISHFRLAAEMEELQNAGYSVFCVVDSLPPPCSSQDMMDSGLSQYWWKEEDLLRGGGGMKNGSSSTKQEDPWKKVGSGRRLDGKRADSGSSISSSGGGWEKSVSEMTEDEMMQFAMAASLEQQTAPSTMGESAFEYELTEEPPEGAPGAVKIQFRLPDGTRAMRRFESSDLVGSIYAFVASKCPKERIELRAGFPPTDISSQRDTSIAESKLAGEMIHGRYI